MVITGLLIQQRILFQFGFDEGGKLKVIQLQQFYGLLQLGGHDQRLALTNFYT